ncbi:MAG: choice-of-anchor D domain-containing protein, partial [Bacteroidota bacterium]|nr:choice-of-anchor D domain-containing protein [Bacteroidota bacterium]
MKRLILLILALAFAEGVAHASVVMSVDAMSAGAGQTVKVGVNIQNDKPFVGFQLDVVFPSALICQADSTQLTARANGYSLAASIVSPGRLRIIAYSISLAPFQGSSGAVVLLEFTTGTVPGNNPLAIENAIVADSSQHNILTSSSNGSVTIQAPNIELSQGSFDFGSIPITQRAVAPLTIHNSGNTNLVISKLSSDRSVFFLDDSSGTTISPSSSIARTIYFQSSKKGTMGGTITVLSNDPDSPTMKIVLTAKAYAVNELHIGSSAGRSGYIVTVPVSINDMEPLTGFQFQLQLPSIAKLIKGSETLTSRKADHIILADTSGSTLNVLSYSPTNKSFTGVNGNVLTLQLLIQGTGGDYGVPVQSALISDSSGANIISASYGGSLQITSPYLSISSNSISYGEISAKDTAASSFMLSNYGSDTLTVSSLQISNT